MLPKKLLNKLFNKKKEDNSKETENTMNKEKTPSLMKANTTYKEKKLIFKKLNISKLKNNNS